MVQYVVLGPHLKVINLNILPESSRNELKYSLKIAFMFLSIILKFQVPKFYNSLNEWINGWMDGRMDGGRDERTNERTMD